jgi:hypothetical protein
VVSLIGSLLLPPCIFETSYFIGVSKKIKKLRKSRKPEKNNRTKPKPKKTRAKPEKNLAKPKKPNQTGLNRFLS